MDSSGNLRPDKFKKFFFFLGFFFSRPKKNQFSFPSKNEKRGWETGETELDR